MTTSDAPPRLSFGEHQLPVRSFNTLIIGSGAAARNAALQLIRLGVTDLAMVTDRWNAGTSYNAGSDKQTYYKLALSGTPDSALDLARDLFAGGCMHGDLALCEALGSARAFFNLVELGVPFPHDKHGGFPGYRTDNDLRGRATSAGPLTSKLMCQALGRALEGQGIRVFDGHQVVTLLTRATGEPGGVEGGEGERAVCGVVAIRKEGLGEGDHGLVVFNALNVILATGGPGGMYRDSVYPQSQRGALGMALRSGAVAQNLTESQFGLASLGFRWNLSGSYQQVIPRYYSTEADGDDEREFLIPHFPDMATLASAIFRKGYEWPFDAGRVENHGSSLIDLLVSRERSSGRKVFLDFTENPRNGEGLTPFQLEILDPEAREYLRRSGAMAGTPIERLEAMNRPAVQLFRDHGIDLSSRPLEIAVCAQHSNGGLRTNLWWESNLRHLFPVGEVAGTHGVRRPGGAALNSGQVGGMRAAAFISHHYRGNPPGLEVFASEVAAQVEASLDFCHRTMTPPGAEGSLTPAEVIREVQERMSDYGAHTRSREGVAKAEKEARRLQDALPGILRVSDPRALDTAFWAADLSLTHQVWLDAIRAYLEAGGTSRGSVLVLDAQGDPPTETLEEEWRFKRHGGGKPGDGEILESWMGETGEIRHRWVPVRPIPEEGGWFEEVWREYREDRVVR